jgi:hypothetical protein
MFQRLSLQTLKNSLSIKQILAIEAHLAEKMVNQRVGKHFYTYLNHLVEKQSLHSCALIAIEYFRLFQS